MFMPSPSTGYSTPRPHVIFPGRYDPSLRSHALFAPVEAATIPCSGRTLRRLCVPLFLVWVLMFVALLSFDNGGGMSGTSGGSERSPAAGTAPAAIDGESADAYVDRTGICDQLSRGMASAADVNETVAEACRRWDRAQDEYFRLRPERVNFFNRSRLVISGANVCSNRTFMIIIVHSLHSYGARREAIRATWGGASVWGTWPKTASDTAQASESQESAEVRLVFSFGRLLKDPAADQRLQAESDTYGDIIQGDFGESYRNMTLKSLTELDWVLNYCPSAKFLFKCDDDMFINVPGILAAVKSEDMTRAIMGPYNAGSRVYRKGKWAIPVDQYPFYHYPPYESGSGYAISTDLIRPLLDASDYVPYIFIDDVYVTGILGRIVGARHVTRPGFAYWTNKAPTSCAIFNGTVLSGTRVDPKKQRAIWNDLIRGKNC